MTATTCNVSLQAPKKAVDFDILRGIGLAISMTIIFVLPISLAILAAIKG